MTIDTRLNGKTAAETIAAMTAILQRFARCLCWSVTCDNNLRSGLSRHRLLVDLFRKSAWFCDAYASRQKSGFEKGQRMTAAMAAQMAPSRHPVRSRNPGTCKDVKIRFP